jgi:chromosome segregation ATPase
MEKQPDYKIEPLDPNLEHDPFEVDKLLREQIEFCEEDIKKLEEDKRGLEKLVKALQEEKNSLETDKQSISEEKEALEETFAQLVSIHEDMKKREEERLEQINRLQREVNRRRMR